LKNKLTPGKKKPDTTTTQEPEDDGYDTEEQEREYQRKRQAMFGPKKSVTQKDLEQVNVSTGKEDANQALKALEAKK